MSKVVTYTDIVLILSRYSVMSYSTLYFFVSSLNIFSSLYKVTYTYPGNIFDKIDYKFDESFHNNYGKSRE